MARYCYLCGKIENTVTALHKFPTNNSTRSLWIRGCGLNENDDVSKLKICSKHFYPDDYNDVSAKLFGGHLKLKICAVPRKRIPNTVYEKRKVSLDKSVPSTSKEIVNPLVESIKILKAKEVKDGNTLGGHKQQVGPEPRTPKRKRFTEPRYLGDIDTSSVATPRHALRSVNTLRQSVKRN